MGLKDFFDKIYCINLGDRTDKWEKTISELEKLGLEENDIDRFPAIKRENGAEGCKLSHLGVLEEAKKLGVNNVLIFEDDVKVLEKNTEHINKILNSLNDMEWDMFYLGAYVGKQCKKVNKINKFIYRIKFAYTTHAYAINFNMFDELINKIPNHKILDVFYSRKIAPKNNVLMCNPIICTQREDHSDIRKQYVKNNEKQLLYEFNKCK